MGGAGRGRGAGLEKGEEGDEETIKKNKEGGMRNGRMMRESERERGKKEIRKYWDRP